MDGLTLFLVGLLLLLGYLFIKYATGAKLAPAPPVPTTPCPAAYVPRGDDQGTEIESKNPATGEVVGREKCFSPDDVRHVVALSKKAAEAWSQTRFAERRAVFRDLMDAILAQKDEICRASVDGTGKTMMEATYGEIMTTLEKLRWLKNEGEKLLSPESRPVPAMLFLKSARIEYYPLGVIGVIIPGNYPFHNVASAVATALMAGNGCVVKVSEWANSSRSFFQDIFRKVLYKRGHNPDLVQVVGGYGQTGAALIGAGVDHVLFIGSPQTGERVMATASKTLTPVTLELGGKDPFIVCEDAEFDHAVEVALRGVFTNCGQNCIAAERIYVHRSIYDRFADRVVAATRQLRQGPDSLESCQVDCGSIAMPPQVAIVERLVNEAVQQGAVVAAGGKRNPKFDPERTLFYEPTVLTNVTHDMKVVNDEAFGPLMVLIAWDNDDQLVEMANSTRYALGCSIFSTNYARAEALARRIVSGMVTINDYGTGYMIQGLPFGGTKDSGFGRFNGPEGLRAFCRVKSVVTDRFPIRTHAPAFVKYPIPAQGRAIVCNALDMVYSRTISGQVSGLLRFLKSLLSK